MSTGRTLRSTHPASTSCAALGASVVGLQEMYTIRRGADSIIRRTTFWESPARGGSTTSTSGRPARANSSGRARRVSPAKKWAFAISLRRAAAIASATACSTNSIPHTSPARGASASAIVPVPQYRSYTRSHPSKAAYSAAIPYSTSAISVLVWKNASGEMRSSSSPRRSGSSASPHTSSVSPPAVVSASWRERVHSTPERLCCGPSSAASAAASEGASSSPSVVTIRTCNLPVRRPSRTTRLRSSARPSGPGSVRPSRGGAGREFPFRPPPSSPPRLHARSPCSRHHRIATRRAWLPSSEASRQSSIASTMFHPAGA